MVTHTPLPPVAAARTSSAKGVVLTRPYYHAAGAGFMQYDGVIYGRISPAWKSGGGGLWLIAQPYFGKQASAISADNPTYCGGGGQVPGEASAVDYL